MPGYLTDTCQKWRNVVSDSETRDMGGADGSWTLWVSRVPPLNFVKRGGRL